jgi:Zn-dependent protease
MRGSFKIANIFNIPVYLHWTFGLILLYAFYVGHSQAGSLLQIIGTIGLLTTLFACVFLHELGHALAAKFYGVRTRDIVLTPLFGYARFERMPKKPVQEFFIALAGPAVNACIAFFIFLAGKLLFVGDFWEIFKALTLENFTFSNHSKSNYLILETGIQPSFLLLVLPALLSANLFLSVFNLIPAFPLDGGRMFRALLTTRIGRLRATGISTWLGQIIAIGLGIFAFLNSQYMLGAVAAMIYLISPQEFALVRSEELRRRFTAKSLVRTQFAKIFINDWMQTPIELVKQGIERNCLIFNLDETLAGILEESEIVDAIRGNQISSTVNQFFNPDFVSVQIGESLENIHNLMLEKGQNILPVFDGEQLVGYIDEAGLDYFLQIQTRLESSKK